MADSVAEEDSVAEIKLLPLGIQARLVPVTEQLNMNGGCPDSITDMIAESVMIKTAPGKTEDLKTYLKRRI